MSPSIRARGASYEVPMIEADRPRPGCPPSSRAVRPRVQLPPDQAAAIPYRIRDGHVEILLVTSRARARWILPKGDIEHGATPYETAQVEAFEESGVQGTVHPDPLGRYRHGRGRCAPLVEVYLLRVEAEAETWPERGERIRWWVPASVAAAHVGVAGLQPVLRRAATALRSLGPD